MTCAGCGAPRALAERICKRCRLCHETGERLELRPPRATPGAARPLARPSRLARLIASGRRRVDASLAWGFGRHAALGLVPGLGHAALGARGAGLAILVATAGLVWLGTVRALGAPLQLACVALAIVVHGQSIFRLTSYREHEDARVRVGAALAIQLVLALLWWPLVAWVAGSRMSPVVARRGAEGEALGGLALTAAAIALCAVAAWALGGRLRRALREGP